MRQSLIGTWIILLHISFVLAGPAGILGLRSETAAPSTSAVLCAQTGCPACLATDVPKPTGTCSGCLSSTNIPLIPEATTLLSLDVSTKQHTVTKRTLPGPINYQGVTNFILWELYYARVAGNVVDNRLLPSNPSSALARKLGNQPFTVAVQGLYGCTSVVVVSEQGVWMSHFWEVPSFASQQAFQKDVLDTICSGDGTDEMPGLKQHTQPGGVFAGSQAPHIMIVTPRDRAQPMIAGALEHTNMVNQLKAALTECVPSVQPTVFDYVSVGSDQDIHDNTAKGKVLVQYDPAEAMLPPISFSPCFLQQATLRVWVEDGPQPVYQHNWLAEPDQLVGVSGHQKRDGDTCSKPASTTVSTSTTSPPATANLPCYNYADPDQGRGDFCTCTNGASVSVAASTGSNTGTAYQPCPWTTIPASATTSMPPKPTSEHAQYAFTDTLLNHDVIECESSTVANYGGIIATMCAGSSVTLSVAPSASVQVGKQRRNVGTLTGTALYTSISSALDKICPTATGNWVSCSTGTVPIKKIDYVSDDYLKQGELVVSVQSSSYNTTKLRDAMIKSAALTAQSSANGTNCYDAVHEVCGDRPPCAPETIKLCNAAGFAGVQYYDGQKTGAAMWLDALWEFEVDSGGAFICEVFLEALDALLITVAPEFAVGDTMIGDMLLSACEDSMSH